MFGTRLVPPPGPLAKYAVRLNKALRATVAPVPVASPAPVPAPDDHTDAALQSLSEYLEVWFGAVSPRSQPPLTAR